MFRLRDALDGPIVQPRDLEDWVGLLKRVSGPGD